MRTTPVLRSLAFGMLVLLVAAVAGLSGCSGDKDAKEETPINRIPTDRWVVRVDGHEISGAWLRNWCVTQIRQLESSGPVTVDQCDMIRSGRELLTKLVLVALEAERRGVTVSDEEIQEKLAEEMSRFPSTETWLKVLNESGLTREDRKEQLRLESLFFHYQDEIVAPEVLANEANDKVTREFYDKFREKAFSQPRSLHLRHILRASPRDAPEEERQREKALLVSARDRAVAGESFADIAKEISTDSTALKGGDIGWIDETLPILPDFKATLLELEEGQVSGVFEGPHGFHLFKAVEVKKAGIQPYEDVKDAIQKRIFSEAIKRRMGRQSLELREQFISSKKLEFFNLVPSTGCVMTPKEEEQVEELKAAEHSGESE